MDTIELARDVIEGDWGNGAERFDVVTVRINGTDLRGLVAEAQILDATDRWETEESARDRSASLDEWLDLEVVAPPSRHWLGQPDQGHEERGRAAVLTCTCRCYGCGGAAARITVEADAVTWSDFCLANSETVVPIGPYRFERAAYEAALAAL